MVNHKKQWRLGCFVFLLSFLMLGILTSCGKGESNQETERDTIGEEQNNGEFSGRYVDTEDIGEAGDLESTTNNNRLSAQDIIGTIDLSNVENINVVLPSPSQLFSALDKSPNIDWESLVEVNQETNYLSETEIALNIGSRSADALILTYANDYEGAGKLWVTIKDLATRLNLDTIINEKQEIIRQALDERETRDLLQALDSVHAAIENYLRETQQEDLAILVSLGGWLEALHLTTQWLSEHYNTDLAELISQSHIAERYEELLSSMNQIRRDNETLSQIALALPQIKELTEVEQGNVITQEKVQNLHQIVTEINQSMEVPQ